MDHSGEVIGIDSNDDGDNEDDNNGDSGEDSNLEHVTQMLPECFVSVKLENNEDCCERANSSSTSPSQGGISSESPTQSCNMAIPSASVMQNLQQHAATPGYGSPYHCFHRHCGSGASDLSQLPPWLSHCYSTQAGGECIQSAGSHVHSSPTYSSPDGVSVPHAERLVKNGSGHRCDSTSINAAGSNTTSSGGSNSSSSNNNNNNNNSNNNGSSTSSSSSSSNSLTSVDGCDSTNFLNYVLHQQRAGGIFLFDTARTAPTDLGVSVNHTCVSNEIASRVNDQTTSTSQHKSIAQSLLSSNENSDSVSRRAMVENSNVHRDSSNSPCTVSTAEGESRSNSSANTASKYSQTVPFASLLLDAKTNTGDYDDDSNGSSSSRGVECPVHPTPRKGQCCCPGEAKESRAEKSEHTDISAKFCSKCNTVSHSGSHCQNVCCNKSCSISKCRTNVGVSSSLESINGVCTQLSCHSCAGCTAHHSSNSVKAENIVTHCFNSVSKLSSAQKGNLNTCKQMNCSVACTKISRKMHYVDVDRPFTCEICFKTYPSSTALTNHTRYHRGERPYQCETCNKAFATNSHLVTHRRVHTGERPFQCQLCRRSFADRSAFVKHERTHGPNGTIIKRYKCEECGNAFVDSCGLKKHIRIHTGERPYQCSVCEKTFSTSSTFVAHKRIHSGERPYKCDQCTKMFITKSHLLTHRRTHTGEKPFTCQVCNRAFADGSSFRRHERLHTGENRHMCDICGKGFPFDTSLAKHKQSHIPGSATYVYMV